MDLPAWAWALTMVVLASVVVFDLVMAVRNPHKLSTKESATWAGVYIGAALLFGVIMFATQGATYGGEFYAGYLTELALSVDNLFVFLLIIQGFRVPAVLQSRVLLVGIVLSIILRGGFIARRLGAHRAVQLGLPHLRRDPHLDRDRPAPSRTTTKPMSREEEEFSKSALHEVRRVEDARQLRLPRQQALHPHRRRQVRDARCCWRCSPSGPRTSCSRSTRSRPSSGSPRSRTWSSPRRSSRSWACASCTSCWPRCSSR